VLGDGVEAMKKKLRLVKSKEERLRAQSESKDEYIAKLENELVKLRESYRIAVEATGYSEEREKEKSAKRLKAFSVSRIRANPSKMLEKNAQVASWRIQADTFEDLMV